MRKALRMDTATSDRLLEDWPKPVEAPPLRSGLLLGLKADIALLHRKREVAVELLQEDLGETDREGPRLDPQDVMAYRRGLLKDLDLLRFRLTHYVNKPSSRPPALLREIRNCPNAHNHAPGVSCDSCGRPENWKD